MRLGLRHIEQYGRAMADDEIDLTRLPNGERGWRKLITALCAQPSLIERYFFEVKSDVDLNDGTARAKIAKFILGAANRDPDRAARRLKGHALLVLGVTADGQMIGIPKFEAHQVEEAVEKYIGKPGPAWDFTLVPTSEGRAVVVIDALPPDPSKQPWLCHRDHPGEKLADGVVYLRVDGQTRPAKARETEAMLARRAAAATPRADISVELTGVIRHYRYDARVVEDYITAVRHDLMDALPASQKRGAAGDMASLQQAIKDAQAWQASKVLGYMTPEHRTRQQYINEISAWAERVRSHIPALLDEVASYAWHGSTIRVASNSGYLPNPRFSIHLDGEVEALDKVSSPQVPSLQMPSPPRRWGPQSAFSKLGHLVPSLPVQAQPLSPATYSRYGIVSFENGGSVTFSMELEDLRPASPQDADDEFVLIYRGADVPQALHATWTATVAGHDNSYAGKIVVPVEAEAVDMTRALKRLLDQAREDE